MSKYAPFGGTTYNLGSSIGSTDTSILLLSFLEPVTGTPYTMALLNTDIAYGTIAPKTTSSEFISFTGITQNANGTATLTGVTRGLAKKYPFTTDASYKLPHSGQTQFIISDAPQVFNKYVSLENAETISGIKTFSTGATPVVTDQPTANNQVANKQYVDSTATGTATYASNVIAGTAGEALTAGEWVYYKTSDQKWWKTDADNTATFRDVRIGVSQTTGSGAINVLISGLDTKQTGLTPGAKYYLSNTAGAIVATTDQTNVVFVGWADATATKLILAYRFDTAGSPYVFTSQYASLIHTTTVTLDWNTGNVQTIQLANGGQTFTFANPQAGGRYILILQQPSSGAAGTVTFPTIKWTGGSAPTLTATNSKYDIVSLIYDGTNYYGATSYNF